MKFYFEVIVARPSVFTRDDWFARQYTGPNEGDDDRDGGDSHNTATGFWQSLEAIAWQPDRSTFYRSSKSYIGAYTCEYAFVYAPTSSGYIAVLLIMLGLIRVFI